MDRVCIVSDMLFDQYTRYEETLGGLCTIYMTHEGILHLVKIDNPSIRS